MYSRDKESYDHYHLAAQDIEIKEKEKRAVFSNRYHNMKTGFQECFSQPSMCMVDEIAFIPFIALCL